MTVEARATVELSALDRAIVEVLAYSDVFDYPLTLEEIREALPIPASLPQVELALTRVPPSPRRERGELPQAAGGEVSPRMTQDGPYYTLPNRQSLVSVRRRRAAASARLMRRARRYGAWIARLPYVRMVAVTGSLAVDNAEATDDVDYLIVTATGRLWLARALTIAVVRLARLRGLTLCPNYLISETALALPERDPYTARELLQMRPVAGHDVYRRMLAANAWCRDLLPNWPDPPTLPPGRRPLLARLGERLLGGRLGDALERQLMQRKGRELRSQAGDNPEAVFTADVCKGHFDAHRARLQERLAGRLRDLGVEP